MIPTLSAPLLLRAYAAGIFPMAESADTDHIDWYEPTRRGILPLDTFHIPRRLARTVRNGGFTVRIDSDFTRVMRECAAPTPGRANTWINRPIIESYSDLHRNGYAHSVECWIGDDLVGGLYGVSLYGAFFGESMFSRCRDASKVALVHLVARLRACGYVLLDTQFITDHLQQFGAIEIDRFDYKRRLGDALTRYADWTATDQETAIAALLAGSRNQGEHADHEAGQASTQTS